MESKENAELAQALNEYQSALTELATALKQVRTTFGELRETTLSPPTGMAAFPKLDPSV
jgi:hypothetical protein